MAGSNDRPEPMDFLQQLMGIFASGGDPRTAAQDVWARATEPRPKAEPSAEAQRENLMFALATRAVEALEDLALNAAAIRQRLEKTGPQAHTVTRPYGSRPGLGDEPRSD